MTLHKYLACGLAVLLTGCQPLSALLSNIGAPLLGGGTPYRDLGVAQYVGKSVLGTEGEFDQIAVSPSGRSVVFTGRESSSACEIFIGDIGGNIRKLASSGLSPMRYSWSTDEKSIMYTSLDPSLAGQPVLVGPTPSGLSLHVVSTVDGSDRKVMDIAGREAFFPSPTLTKVALCGAASAPPQTSLTMLDVASGTSQALTGNLHEVYLTTQGTWSPDGSQFLMTDFVPPGTNASDECHVLHYRAPDWKLVGTATNVPWSGQVWWQPDGHTAVCYRISTSNDLTVTSVPTDGPASTTAAVALEAPPADLLYGYTPYACPDGQRVLLVRQASPFPPRDLGMSGPPIPPPSNLLVDLQTHAVKTVADGLTPIAWLDAKRLLAYSGRNQNKTLRVVTP